MAQCATAHEPPSVYYLKPDKRDFITGLTVREGLRTDLTNLPIDALPMLFPQMLYIDSLEQLEQWIADRLPVNQA